MNKYVPPSSEGASAAKIAAADSNPKHRRELAHKLDQIAAFISCEARRAGVGSGQLTCPDPTHWQQLSHGRNPVLPSEALLRLYASEGLVEQTKTLLRQTKQPTREDRQRALMQAYFTAAQQQLTRQQRRVGQK